MPDTVLLLAIAILSCNNQRSIIFGIDRGDFRKTHGPHGFDLIAAGVILFGLVSNKFEGTIITAPLVFAAFGLLSGQNLR